MRFVWRSLILVLFGLLALAGLGQAVVERTTNRWFVADLDLRSQLAVDAARADVGRNWWLGENALRESLAAMTRDERILGAAACTESGQVVASTDSYPEDVSCRSLLLERGGSVEDASGGWSSTVRLPAGDLFIRVVEMEWGEGPTEVGYVVLAHDMSYLERRAETTRVILLSGFVTIAAVVALLTFLVVRNFERGVSNELQRGLAGDVGARFSPLLRDVQALARRLADDLADDRTGRFWDPDRLRAALRVELEGDRVFVVSNREPYAHEFIDEEIVVRRPASGLVTALEPVVRACSGVWIAHGGGTADRATVDARDRVLVPPGLEEYALRRVWIDDAQFDRFYNGFSNEGLWALCHLADQRPIFRPEDFESYRDVNSRFVDAICAEVDHDDPVILVQDYHLALVPRMLRERLPRATIVTFWHIPWPNAERVGICPWRAEIIDGLLGSSVVGFQTRQHVNNFFDSVDAFMESRIDREHDAVVQSGRHTLVRPYPISIDSSAHAASASHDWQAERIEIRSELGAAPDALLGLGVDRLDYTKGILERLRAVDALLERNPRFRGRFHFVQVGSPSRLGVAHYRHFNDQVLELADQINARWGTTGYEPILLRPFHHDAEALQRLYRSVDLCFVSSLHDGMNLVAKEFVASRADERGVLVLSSFTGSARELTEALIVNPYDVSACADALAAALDMPPSEQALRLHAMRKVVERFNVYFWAGSMLVDASEIRRKDRLAERLGSDRRMAWLGRS